MWLTMLLKYKKHIAIIGVILSLVIIHNVRVGNAFDRGYDSATAEIQRQHNILIQQQSEQYAKDLNEKMTAYNESLKAIKVKQDYYWQKKMNDREAKLIAEHQAQIKTKDIKNNASHIDGNISVGALELFQQSKGIIIRQSVK